MRTTASVLALSLLLLAAPAFAAKAGDRYQLGGKNYYLVDGNNPNMNSGDRVCQSLGLKCAGYTAHTSKLCKNFHPDAKTDYGTVNGSSAEFYCDSKERHDIACQNEANTCLSCAACGINATCSDQVDYHFAEMYVECVGTSTPPTASSTPPTPQPAAASHMTFGDMFRAFWQNIFAHAWWYHPAPAAPAPAQAVVHAAPMVGHTGTKLPAQQCANGGECKSGNCVRDGQGVYRCSCSPLGSDYSSCH